jgi:hypothetical protein
VPQAQNENARATNFVSNLILTDYHSPHFSPGVVNQTHTQPGHRGNFVDTRDDHSHHSRGRNRVNVSQKIV